MINKTILIIACFASLWAYSPTNYSTTAVIVLVGAKIKASHQEDIVVKYKRQDCPVCKGKGWYMSGDGIKKIECTYCEP